MDGLPGCGTYTMAHSVQWPFTDGLMFRAYIPPSAPAYAQLATTVRDADGSAVVEEHTDQTSSGAVFGSIDPHVQSGHTYLWSMATFNPANSGYSASTPDCSFIVDRTPPGKPSISSSDFLENEAGTYLPMSPIGGDITGTFHLHVAPDVLPDGCTSAQDADCRTSGVDHLEMDISGTGDYQAVPASSSGDVALRLRPGYGVHTLSVRAVDRAGNRSEAATYQFNVPEMIEPSIELSGQPTAAVVGQPVTVSGRVSPGGYAPGKTVWLQWYASDYSQGGSSEVPLGADGSFAFTTTPTFAGSVKAVVRVDEDNTHRFAENRFDVQVAKAPTSVRVTTGATRYRQGATATVSVHLTGAPGGTVSVYAQPVGSARTLVKSGQVDRSGNLTIGYKPAHNTTFSALYAGDANHTASASTGPAVTVVPNVAESLSYTSGTVSVGAGRYALYHRNRHRPVIVARSSPRQRGACYRIILQRYSSHAWHTVTTTACVTVRTDGSVAWTVPWSSLPLKGLFRVSTTYTPPRSGAYSAAASSGWLYFTVRR